ncbi:5-oxoprolinase subunit PxpB [Nocardia sp. NPDC058666]|uniref:5-oxoprolinase subunit PxpB n=1 Tax=Nocardia sp. NPDC058666 TaxID=3346587 RepID=UPI00366754FB
MRMLPCADAGLLLEVGSLREVLALADAVRAADFADVLDVVPAARTVLLTTRRGADLEVLRRAVLDLDVEVGAVATADTTVEVPVHYDGPDLAEVAALTGLSAEQVIHAHTNTPWRVAFGGFAPGFAYLAEGDRRLYVPRRAEPRASVPASSVGLAAEFSGIYPRSSPGGWQLIGRTDVVLWDAERDPPALLRPGAVVRFVDAGKRKSTTRPAGEVAAERRDERSDRHIEVLATGALALVQDLGRPGLAANGVGRSGAADRAALRLANRLVANPEEAAGIEITLGGLAVRAGADLPAPLELALTGAAAPATVDGTPVGHRSVITLSAGQTLRLAMPAVGLRTYLAVRGGIDVPEVLGSRSTDVLSGIGPPALTAGTVLPIGRPPTEFPLVDQAPGPAGDDSTVTLRVVLGPRDDWLHDPAGLHGSTWTASDRSNRVGMRLTGGTLRRCRDDELPSEGTVRGAIQVPPGGEPVIFLADHPVTGGYPVIGVVVDADVDVAAQVRPGRSVRLVVVDDGISARG